MNGIRLFFRGQKGGVLSALTLFVVLGAVLLALNYALSQYLYIRRAGAMLERAGLSEGLHFVNTTPYDEENQIKLDAFLDELQAAGEIEKQIAPISTGVLINGVQYRLELYDGDVYPAMYGAPYRGSWPDGGEVLGGVLCGVRPTDAPVGETVTVVTNRPGGTGRLEVRITGSLEYPPMHFHLGFHTTDAADMTADKLFDDERTLYLPYSDALATLVTDTFNDGFAAPVSSGVLLLRDSVSAARCTEIWAALEEYAEVTTMEALLESTRAYVGASLRRLLPMPLFLLAVTSLAYISVAVLGLYRRRADFTIYAMEGCTKRRMLLLAAAQAALPLLFTDAAVAAVVLTLQKQAESGAFALPGVLFGWQNLVWTAAASLLLLAIVVGIAAFTIGRFSPVEELRRSRE